MKILFQQAKNGELTAIADDVFLHSSYNPSREAERFVSNIEISYSPSLILVLEPAVSYIVPLLKKRFLDAQIAIIRYLPDFSKYNTGADFIFNYYEHKNDFENFIFNTLGEEKIISALIVQWQPSSRLFPEIENDVLSAIKSSMEKAKTLLVTREFFEKKWFINSCNFIKYINHPIIINKKINVPVVIISSGPSLKDSLNIIKNNRTKLFILCLSSAIKVCISNNIIPDLCLSTDGGFWAGEHLKSLLHYNIPLALPSEGYCPKAILQNNDILPLLYNDGLSKEIMNKVAVPSIKAERNGTVSGTALILALYLCENDIFFCGLDMCSQKGFQHCQPNEIELNNCLKDNKIKSLERRLTISEYSKGVLSIYKEWFDYLKLNNRNVYRVIERKYKKNSLGEIKDIKTDDFNRKLSLLNCKNSQNYFEKMPFEKQLKSLSDYVKKNIKTEKWIKNIFPLSMSSLRHNPNNTDIINRLKKESLNLMFKTENILNE